ncbi:MAG: hypothetical protein KY451_04955 [Actinobacteria bacterium]|nr:hypothetical protein [Actinomycetota bacterium]MBW3647650.1 hypothetical protein [Actinomycetota bacterium]
MPVSSYHFLIGPLMIAIALGVILLICRWVFSTSHRDRRATPGRGSSPAVSDYGLLVPVATVRTREDAEMLRSVLREASIRCSVSDGPDGLDVLVFSTDVSRARGLVSR